MSNVQEALRPITITTAVGSVVCTKLGKCKVTDIYVWMRPLPGNLNIISFSQADHMGFDVGWCPAQRCFFMGLGDGTVLTFRLMNGLYQHRLGSGHNENF